MDTRSAQYFSGSVRFVNCHELLEERIALTPKGAEDLRWAGELLESIDWDCANHEAARQNYQLSGLASSLRPLFYQTLLSLGKQGHISADSVPRTQLENIYTALKSGELGRMSATEKMIASYISDEFQEYLLRSTHPPGNI